MLADLISSIGEGILALDQDLRFLFVNEAAERLIGIPRADILGKRPAEVLPAPVVAQALPHVQRVMATGAPAVYETHLPGADRWFESRCYRSKLGVTILFVDVTERRRAEDALRRREGTQALLVSLTERTRHLRDPDEVMWTYVRALGEHLHVSRCMFGEADVEQLTVFVARDYVDGVPTASGRHRLDDFGAPTAAEIRGGRTLIIRDSLTDPRTAAAGAREAYLAIGVRSLLVVPLVKDGRLVAVLSAHHNEPRDWSDDEVALLERVAEQTWFAVATARAEADLRESRDVLALAMRGGRMGAWSRNLDTGEVWWSHELEEIFGLPPGGFAGTESGFLQFVHEDDRPRVERAVGDALSTRSDYVVEFRFRHTDGSWRWMDGRGRAVYASDGTPLGLYGIGIDITERKAAEAALEMARAAADADAQRLHLAMVAARLGDWSWDLASDIVTFSPRGAEIFGIPHDRRITWREICDELLDPIDAVHARLAVQQAITTGADYAIEYRLLGPSERWVSARGRARFDAIGRVTGMLGIVQDISHDRLLTRLDDALRNLAGADDIKATAARMLGEYLRVDRCTYAMFTDDGDRFSVTCDYASGLPSMVGDYRMGRFGPEFSRTMESGIPYVVEDCASDWRLRSQQREAYAQFGIGALVSAPIMKAGRLLAAMSVHARQPRRWRREDVDLVQQVASRCWESMERARVEADRAALLARERLAREEAELQNHRLAQLSEAAEAANRAKDEFMAMLGHELRNPLAPILTALQLMKLRGDSGSERERVVIERQVNHLTRLVDDLLDVSRIARGKVELKPAPVEVAEVVARAIEMASPLLEQRTHTLVVDVPRSGLMMLADAARMSQVVANLLTNAAKYTPPGGRITVTARADEDSVVVSVADTGIGMTADVLPTVFDLFVQGRQASDRAEGGLGLGLTIVRNLVERHGGSVSAHSDGPGTGSQFTIRLPQAPVPSPRDVEAPTRDIARVRAAVAGASRVLIVDDNEDAAEMLAHVLSVQGHDTRVAHDGIEALHVAADFRPQAAFLDLGLPVMDGYELASRLRALPGLDTIRLIAVTGYGQDSDRRRTRAAGFQHHLVKPVDISVIEALLA